MGAGDPVLRHPAGGQTDHLYHQCDREPHSTLRTAVRRRGHFLTDEAAIKLLYLVLRGISKNWKGVQREWTAAKTQFAILFVDRFSVE